MKINNITSIIMVAVVGMLVLSGVFYSVQVVGMQDWQAPYYFFLGNWYLVSPLIIGFGIQVGLSRAIKIKMHTSVRKPLIVSSTTSTVTMIACCMHNFVIFLPIIGLTGVATFFAIYQTWVFIVSILIMLVSVVTMGYKYTQIHSCCKKDSSYNLSH